MGLNHPVDLERWRIESGLVPHPLRALISRLRHRDQGPNGALSAASTEADILVVLDSSTPSSLASVAAPIAHLDPMRVAVLAPAPVDLRTHRATSFEPCTTIEDLSDRLPVLRCIITIGHHLPLGERACALAADRGITVVTVQHGLLTPMAPPLPSGTELLAWSAADGEFWASGRTDVTTTVVGSQLLWEAHRASQLRVTGHDTDHDPGHDTGPTIHYLGQLHGHELPRRQVARASVAFCLDHDAVYRPHPSEIDIESRLRHRLWRRRGVRFDDSRRPLAELDGSIVAMFSTGVLEAAAAGRPAWVSHPDPPVWLRDMWDRYGMSEYGSAEPTRVEIPEREPALSIAGRILEIAGEGR